ncbi:MAG: T9SS type A sorting domain-containing protein [Bacteroidota bacterium]|nr:T9SS type A sorting domain-containing protein [Bacteroidota bacterium]
MKRLIFIISFLLVSFALSAQNQINAYQYWFNEDFNTATTVTITPEQTLNFQTDIDASQLNTGVHIFYLRFKDDNGLWSSPQAQFIYRFLSQSAAPGANKIVEYQYWFDAGFDAAVNQTVTASQNYQMLTDIDASAITPGVHLFYIRHKDDLGQWSSPVAQFFYKFSEQVFVQNNEISRYQYWFDDGFDDAVSQSIPSSSNFQLISDIDATALSSGVHIFYLRFQDEKGQWSSPVAQFIYKMAIPESGLEPNEIVAYQYWFDANHDDVITESVSATQNLLLATDIDAGAINPGVHIFYLRFLDNRGQWSSTISQFIYKIPESLSIENKIIAYRYWFNDDFTNVYEAPISPAQSLFSLSETIDMTQMWKGEYTLHYQFKDTLGMWSSPTVDTIEKIAHPIAEFTYSRLETCDSTIIDFQNLSMDGDTHYWDFGDGAISSDSAASHVYYGTGNYLVSLTVTDTSLNVDSTMTEIIHIIGPTSSSLIEEVCDVYEAPSGTLFTESGIHYDTISNYMFCDSVIEIDLTVLESTFAEVNVHACDSFVAPSGDVYFASGQYFDTIPNVAGCDSIIEITLDLGNTSFASINEDVCDVYLSPAGNNYTESGVYFDTIQNASLCDSIIEINLNIRESSYGYLIEEVCDEYLSPAGNIYTESGLFYDTIPNAATCDSIIEIDLTVLESTFAEMIVHACDSFVSPSGDMYFASGQYFDTIANVAGCDSIIEINLDVTTIDNTISLLEEGLAANQNDANYQWLNCDMDIMEIDGATGQEFFPDVDGNYAVRISLNDCEKTSECYEIFGLFTESSIADGLKVYPNPTDGLVKISLPEIKSTIQVSVYDITGRLVQHFSAQNTDYIEFTIDAPKAVYLIKLFADKEMYSKAIVVE